MPKIAVTIPVDHSGNDELYKFVFDDLTHPEMQYQQINIGASPSSALRESLTFYKNNEVFSRLAFHYLYSSFTKKDAIKFNRFVAIGFSGYFYLYDLSTGAIVLFIDLNGYFVSITVWNKMLVVAYNSGLYCLTEYGQIKWHNSSIGIDGVLVKEIGQGKIYGSEQIDPPEGWNDFTLDIETGRRL